MLEGKGDMGLMASAAHEATALVGWASSSFLSDGPHYGWAKWMAVRWQRARRRAGFARAPLSATTSNLDGRGRSEAAAAPRLRENVSRFGGGSGAAQFQSTGCYDERRRRVAPPCRSVHGTCLWMGLLALPRREKRIVITCPGATTRHDTTRHDTTGRSNP